MQRQSSIGTNKQKSGIIIIKSSSELNNNNVYISIVDNNFVTHLNNVFAFITLLHDKYNKLYTYQYTVSSSYVKYQFLRYSKYTYF